MTTSKSPLRIAVFTIFLDLLGFGIVVPIQAFYAEHFGASATLVTLIGASYSLMQFIFAPLWGRLSDKYGRRPIMLSSIAIGSLSYLVFAGANHLWLLFASRMLSGFGNANLGTAQAIISDTTTTENRAKGMGLIGAAFGMGFIFGPALGGALGTIDPRLPPLCACLLGLINLFFAWRNLPETLDPANKVSHSEKSPMLLTRIRDFSTVANVSTIFLISLLYVTAFASMEQVMGLLVEKTWVPLPPGQEHIALAARLTAYVLVCVGVTLSIVQGGLIGRLNKKFGEVSLIRVGLVTVALALFLMPRSADTQIFSLFMIVGALLAVGAGIVNPSINSLLSKSAPPSRQGEIFGVNQSCSSLGRVIGPATAGALFQVSHYAPFTVGASIVAFVAVLSLRLKQTPESVVQS